MPHGGASISAESYHATHAPYAPSEERRGEWGALTRRFLWDWENGVTPFKPITLSKTLCCGALRDSASWCQKVHEATWKKNLSSVWVLSTLKNGSLKWRWREQGTEKRGGGLQKNPNPVFVALCAQCHRHSSFHRKSKIISESPSSRSLAPAGLLYWYYFSRVF